MKRLQVFLCAALYNPWRMPARRAEKRSLPDALRRDGNDVPGRAASHWSSRPLLCAIAILAMTWVAYLPALRAGYIWDDDDHVTQNAFQRTPTVLKWVWSRLGTTPQYYPLTHTMFWIEGNLWGDRPFGYHLVNILLHAANAILVWRVLRRLQSPQRWLIGSDLRGASGECRIRRVDHRTKEHAFGIFLSACDARGDSCMAVGRRTFGKRAGIDGACIGLGRLRDLHPSVSWPPVLSKTVTCTLPAAFLLILWWKRGRITRRDGLLLLPLFAIALAVAKITSGMEQWNVGAEGRDFEFSLAQRILIAGRAVWFYAGKIVWPHPLAFIYPRWTVDSHALWQWAFPVSAIAVVALLWFARKRIGRGPLVAALFFIGTLFPALGFVNVYPMRFSFVADHFQYLASLGVIVVIVQALCRLGAPFWIWRIGCLLLIVPTFLQARIYKDADSVWLDTLAKNPDCWLAMDNLGASALARGELSAAEHWYLKALAIHPGQMEAHFRIGTSMGIPGPMG